MRWVPLSLLMLLGSLPGPAPAAGPARATAAAQRALLKDWALARCIGRGLGPGKAQDDAYASAAALLERGDYGVEIYNRVDALVDTQLARRYGGSVPGDYVTLKCLDLHRGAVLDRAVARFRPTPVR